jgi:predicted permease
MYNSLSAVVLAVYSPDLKSDPWSICKSIFSNPLIISVLVATPMAYGQVPPNWLLTSPTTWRR